VASLLIALVIVVGTWGLFRQSLHLMVDGVPAHLNLVEVRECLLGLQGVAQVHDLHVWAMGTAEVALTAHLVMPDGPADDQFLATATTGLRERFGIAHVTLQTSRKPLMAACGA
jgi:cobalt-zinc-cadmium efflux system protein